eukprot:GFKZ01010716.1.p1 GENE.GFKZ01010716.1~~GFKZ01010716.1.p1  ORF type:complete len:637 (+),score=88.64 GFKZ01010716.1:37-1947(+)
MVPLTQPSAPPNPFITLRHQSPPPLPYILPPSTTTKMPPLFPDPSMLPPHNYTPSIPEVLSLHALIPPTPPTPLHLPSLLHPFLSTISPPYLRNFLFSSAPHHLPAFLSPTLSTTSFTTTFSTTRVEPITRQPSPYLPESHHLTGRNLYTPHLTTPSHTLGFGAMEVLATSGQFWCNSSSNCAACMPFRFIRHNPTNLLIHIYDTPCPDAVLLNFSQPTSSTTALAVTAMFTKSQLIDILQNSPTPDALIPAAHFIQQDLQRRACPFCAAPPGTDCSCPITPVQAQPQHPFDHAHFANSMSVHNGVFESLTSKRLFPIQGSDRHCFLGTRTWMATVKDPAFVKRIADWAFADYVSIRSGATPSRSLPIMREGVRSLEAFQPPKIKQVAHVEADGDAQDETQQIDDSADIDITLAGNNQAVHLLAPATQPVEDLWWAETCHRQATVAYQGGMLGSEGALGGLDGMSMTLGMGDDINCLELDANSATLVLGDLGNTKKPEAAKGVMESSGESNSRGTCLGREALVGRSEDDRLPTGNHRGDRGVAQEGKDGEVGDDREERREGPAVNTALLAKQLKAKRRREKNRLCAQRSNMRAKAHRDALKINLKSCHEQVEVLRAKELALRQENLKLRQFLGENS